MMRARRNEDGAVAITTALVLVVLIMLAAFLVDMGGTRADARTDQLLADSALMAGALTSASAVDQCKASIDFFAANVNAGSYTASPHPCEDLPTTCTNGVTAPVSTDPPIQIGDYTIVVTHPVNEDDPAMTVEGQGITDRDGEPCHRLKIQVSRSRDFTFGGAGGAQGSGASVNDAVAVRKDEGGPSEYATLIILEQERCPGLTTDGQGSVVIQNEYDSVTGDITAAGVIHIDSNATVACSGNSGNARLVHPGGSNNSAICSGVDGRNPADISAIILNADCGVVEPDTLRTEASDKLALEQYLAGGVDDEQLEWDPLPVSFRITRELVDHEYNCLDTNPDDASSGTYPTSAPQYPDAGLVEPIPLCQKGRPPHINELINATMTGSPPAGFTPYTACGSAAPVNIQFVYVDCDQLPRADFTSDVIVLRGGPQNSRGVNVGTGESVSVSPYTGNADADSTILVVRDGNLRVAGGGSLALNDTFVYLHDGHVAINGGENVTWHAPDQVGYDDEGNPTGLCTLYGPSSVIPHPSCFQYLGLWSNVPDEHSFAGSGAVDVLGRFFTPKAPFKLTGSGNAGVDSPMQLEDAQFFTRTLTISGGSGVIMKPNSDIFIETPPPAPGLIR